MQTKLLYKEEILKIAVPHKKESLVYFLIKNKVIVYIGRSINFPLRLGIHERTKDFDSYAILKCSDEELFILEGSYIIKFAPKYNSLQHIGLSNKLYKRSKHY